MQITLPVTVESIATRSDNTIKIVIATQDLPPNEASILFQLKGKLGNMLFSDEYITEMPANLPPPPRIEGKTPGQRLRSIIFLNWEQNTDKSKPFENYYNEQMERIIERCKENLK